MFIIIKYCIRSSSFTDIQEWRYAKVTVKSACSLAVKDLTKGMALDLIRDRGLVLAHHDKNGTVWDTPDHAFQTEYKGRIRINGDI